MLLLLQQAILKVPPSATDSLKRSLAQLQHEVDSLKRLTQTSEIAKGFFSEIISLQLGIFLLLVGIAGWVSWGFLTERINQIKQEANSSAQNLVNEYKHSTNLTIHNIQKKLYVTQYDVCRSMYSVAGSGNTFLMFGWALRAAMASHKWDPDQNKNTIHWIGNARKSIKYLTYQEPYNLANINGVYKMFRELDQVNHVEVATILKEIKIEFHKVMFTPPAP